MIAATAIAGVAQQRDPNKVAADYPVPLWPSTGVIPPDLKSHYVFVDAAKNEFVVAYPENLGSPNFEKDGPSTRQVSRYKLQMYVDPRVSVAIAASAGGKFRYAYTVADGPAAKGSVDQWALTMPEAAGTSAAKFPTGWFGVVQKSRKMALGNDWIKSGSAAVYSFDKVSEQIKPGSKKSGFELESDLKPGFTLGFFRQAENTEAQLQQSGNIPTIIVKNATPPPTPGAAAEGGRGGGGGFGGAQTPAGATAAWQPIKDDVEKLMRIEYNSKPALTLGPKFDKSASDAVIAADFQQGITMLSKSGVLTADSAFVKSTLAELDTYVKAGGSGPLKLSGQPKTEAETEVFNAMKISLHLN